MYFQDLLLHKINGPYTNVMQSGLVIIRQSVQTLLEIGHSYFMTGTIIPFE
jgi:hypothetical protein